ncbi:transposase [Massilia sp. 9096]|uniref:transposase n=1 Tax=Massilia sp. 9096 TaxID=1500894 RepID=UPI00056B84D8|nr:transposase [Massilia sp. 9096]
MARQPRLILPNQPHLVIQRGNDNQHIFRDEEDHERFLGWLKECARFYKVAVHAYVLMPSHVIVLATPADEDGLALMMQKVGRYYVPWFNNKHGRSGTLFQGRFRTAIVDAVHYMLACSRHIELAPVRAQLAAGALDYRWSSYAHHAGARSDALITDHMLYWGLGNTPFQREAAYTALVEQGQNSEELTLIDTALAKGAPVGSRAFMAELEKKTQRRILPAKRGRPAKAAAPVECAAPPRGV